ncbi:glycosyltransferase family 39 protein [Nostocaceae cyanobacterium CENA369]|uniref:Glycosyltransferase family 39 protein n=1 Tax=Dendronalium phyllosphericum CENA369 TaxID=1725256 RepID=A0A8J7LF49_9NOST|nr:glycosyltransferase family 39 protein [Dendronalium phyllosphericum]MBH8571614.1 glycosyltransferase family 39 protein [Dendronalium phyllosphericum CENA369]
MRTKLSFSRTVDQWFNKIVERPALAVTVSILWLILIGWVGYVWNLGNIGLIDETEPLFAEASRQMFVTGDWITPFFNGETRFDKPALIYWCQAIAYAVIGVNEWAVRLPSALAAIAVISLAFYTVQWHLAKQDELEKVSRPTRRYLGAAVATAMMAFNPEMIVWGRTGVSDMLLTGCVASALLCFFLGYAGRREQGKQGRQGERGASSARSLLPNGWYLAFYVLIAGAILTKGPVGIVLPGLIILAFLLYVGKLREVLREMRFLLGMLIIVGLSVPWYVLVIWRNGWNYINSFFGYHNLERFTEVVNGHSAPWFFYFIVVLLGFAPYSVYLPVAIVRLKLWQRSHWLIQERSQQLALFACIWFLGVFGFFTVAVTKLPSYVLPLMPASAILVALLWSDFFQSKNQVTQGTGEKAIASFPSSPLLLWSSWLNVVFLSALAVAMFHLSQLLGRDQAAPDFRLLIDNSGLPKVGGLLLLSSAIIIAFLIIVRRWHSIIGVNLLVFVAFLSFVLMPTTFLMDRQRQLPLRELSAVIVEAQQPNEELLMVGFKKPSVVFYSHKQINFIKLTRDAVSLINNQAAQPIKPPSLLMLAEQTNIVKMNFQPDDYENIAAKGAYQLIRVSFKKMKHEKLNIS